MLTAYDGPTINAAAWIDGEMVAQNLASSAGKITSATRRESVHIEPGVARATLGIAYQDGLYPTVDYRETTINISGNAAPFVLPTVPSEQVLEYPTVRSMFHTPPSFLVEDGVLQDFRDAGINCIECSAFTNPADNPGITSLAVWRQVMDLRNQPAFNLCVEHGFDFLAYGDDFFRFQWQRDWLHTSDYREAAIRETASRLLATGRCRGIEMVDEVEPFPSGYVPEEFIGWWRAEGGPKISWPNLAPYLWEVPELSDYSSRYYHIDDLLWTGRVASLWQIRKGFTAATANPRLSAPLGIDIGTIGPFYQKLVAGIDYQEGDHLYAGWTPAKNVIAEVWLGLAMGASRFRMYGYDWKLWRNQRANAIPGVYLESGLQTAARPGLPIWAGVSRAYNSVARREAVLNATAYIATTSGPWVFGRRGNLVWSVNCSERALPSPNGPGTVITPDGETNSSTVPAGGVILWQ